MKIKNGALLLLMLLAMISCGKKGETPPPSHNNSPGKANLLFPDQNSVCITGKTVSDTVSTVEFRWSQTAHTDVYELDIKNLLTGGTIIKTPSTNSIYFNLLRGTPYSWFIVSKSNSITDTAKSDVWKFYNSGPGKVSYAPFPAIITSPKYGQVITALGGTVNLTWTGTDVDNDITSYDLYFGTSTTPGLLHAGVTNMFLNGVTVSSGTTYYWKVITTDAAGNTSDSGVYEFEVN